MEKKMSKVLLVFLITCIISFMCISPSSAFLPVTTDGGAEITVYGSLKNIIGVFTDNPEPVTAGYGSDLAMFRTVLRTNIQVNYSDNLKFWSVLQFSHEPWYEFETGATSSKLNGGPVLRNGREYSEYDNINEVLREIYVDFNLNANHSLRIGRQIVVWGESFFPILDAIHDSDGRTALAYQDPEASYIPLWMVRGNHYIPKFEMSFEWVVAPPITGKPWRGSRRPGTGQRLAGQGEDRTTPNSPWFETIGIPAPAFFGGWPFVNSFAEGPPGSGVYFPTEPFDIGAGESIKSGLKYARYGFRTSQTAGFLQYGFEYFRKPASVFYRRVVPNMGGPGVSGSVYEPGYKHVDMVGTWFNYDAEAGLFKGDLGVFLNQPYQTIDRSDPDGVDEVMEVKFFLGYDVGTKYTWWKKVNNDQPVKISFGFIGDWVQDADKLAYLSFVSHNRVKSFQPTFSVSASTTYFVIYGISTSLFYNPRNNEGNWSTAFTFKPSWMNYCWNFELKYSRIFANTPYNLGIGSTEDKDRISLGTAFYF